MSGSLCIWLQSHASTLSALRLAIAGGRSLSALLLTSRVWIVVRRQRSSGMMGIADGEGGRGRGRRTYI